MDFLDKLVLPQSAHHMVLLKYLLALTNFVFLSYICVLVGTTVYSIYFKDKSFRTGEKKYLNIAKDLVNILTPNKVIAAGLGIIPIISIMFGYLQLLHESEVNISGVLILSLLLLSIGMFFVYTYRQNINLTDLLNHFEDSVSPEDRKLKEEIVTQKSRSRTIFEKAGNYGVLLLLASLYLFAGASKLAEDTARWGAGREVFTSILSLSTLAYFLLIVCLSILAASSVVLYYYFRPNSEYTGDKTVLGDVKDFTGKSGLIASLFVPVLIVFLISSLSQPALSYSIFLIAIILLFVVILISSLYYLMIRKSEVQYSLSILFLMAVLFLSVVGVNVAAFDSATKSQFKALAEKYDAYKEQVLKESGAAVAGVSGEEIYNGRCIACHKFDQKLVGPPYNEVLPKYEGDRAGLIQFILNPVKVNPEYPAMPNQGLKPNEAEAVADYILNMYNQKK